jgi:hypothetical protein
VPTFSHQKTRTCSLIKSSEIFEPSLRTLPSSENRLSATQKAASHLKMIATITEELKSAGFSEI